MPIRQLVIAFAALALTGSIASAQAPQGERLRGTVALVDGSVIELKTGDGKELKVKLADNVMVIGQYKATIEDIKAGNFVGIGAMPQPDGTQRAIQVVIFPEAMRGVGEGHRPWNQPNSTMTNGAVDTAVTSVEGRTLTVRYKEGEKKIVVPPTATLIGYVNGERSEIKPGAAIAIPAAARQADGTYTTARINVGRAGFVPQ